MKIYTKTGDTGETGLYGGERVPKHHLRVQAYGTVDEVNASLGLARAALVDTELDDCLAAVQNALFDVGADLATRQDSKYRKNIVAIDEADIAYIEGLIDRFDEELEPLSNFILPGGHPASAALQMARTICRRAEREVVSLAEHESINTQVAVYLNRLSDLLFTMARVVNKRADIAETRWHVKGRQRPEA